MDDLDSLTDFEILDRWLATPEGKAREIIEDALATLAEDPDVRASPLCLQFIRLCQRISPAGDVAAESVIDLTQPIKAYYESAKASGAGKKGASVKHAPTNALKKWALEKAKTMRGNDKTIAENIVKILPDHLKEASKDPERFIYDELRKSKKKALI